MAETSPQIELSQEQLSVIKGRLDQLDTSLNTRRRMDDIRLVALGGLVPLLCLGLVVIVAILVIPDLSAIQLKGVDDGDFMKLAVPIFTLAFGFVVGILGLKRFEQFDQEIARLRESLDRRALEERTMRAEEFRDFQARIQDGEAALLKKVATIEEQLVEELRSQRDEARQQRAELRNSLVKSQKEADERIGLFQQIRDWSARMPESNKPTKELIFGEISKIDWRPSGTRSGCSRRTAWRRPSRSRRKTSGSCSMHPARMRTNASA